MIKRILLWPIMVIAMFYMTASKLWSYYPMVNNHPESKSHVRYKNMYHVVSSLMFAIMGACVMSAGYLLTFNSAWLSAISIVLCLLALPHAFLGVIFYKAYRLITRRDR